MITRDWFTLILTFTYLAIVQEESYFGEVDLIATVLWASMNLGILLATPPPVLEWGITDRVAAVGILPNWINDFCGSKEKETYNIACHVQGPTMAQNCSQFS